MSSPGPNAVSQGGKPARRRRNPPNLIKSPGGVYVSRRVWHDDAVDLAEWARDIGIKNVVPPEEMHITLAYSKTPFHVIAEETPLVLWLDAPRLKRLGPNGEAIVLAFQSEALHRRWEEFRNAGADWKWPSFQPHITLAYDDPDFDIEGVEVWADPIMLNSEVVEPLNDNWAQDKGLKKRHDRVAAVLEWVAKYNDDQPRDDHGRWTDGGGSSSSGGTDEAGRILSDEQKEAKRQRAKRRREAFKQKLKELGDTERQRLLDEKRQRARERRARRREGGKPALVEPQDNPLDNKQRFGDLHDREKIATAASYNVKNLPDTVTGVIRNTPPVAVYLTEKNGVAFYRPAFGSIHHSPLERVGRRGLGEDTKEGGLEAWGDIYRHEYGHHVDTANAFGGRQKLSATMGVQFAADALLMKEASTRQSASIMNAQMDAINDGDHGAWNSWLKKNIGITADEFKSIRPESNVRDNFSFAREFELRSPALAYARQGNETGFLRHQVPDFIAGVSAGKFGYGHSQSYWARGAPINSFGHKDTHATEAFANFYSVWARKEAGDPKGKLHYAVMKRVAPNVTEAFEKALHGIANGKRRDQLGKALSGEVQGQPDHVGSSFSRRGLRGALHGTAGGMHRGRHTGDMGDAEGGVRDRRTASGSALLMEKRFYAKISKVQEDQRLVYAWASVVEKDGKPVVDWQEDVIELPTIQKAAHVYITSARASKAMHAGKSIGEIVESLVFTPELQKALGIDLGKVGWFVVIKVHSDEVWKKVKNGTYKMLSIGGNALRVSLGKFNQNHDQRGRFSSGEGSGGGGDHYQRGEGTQSMGGRTMQRTARARADENFRQKPTNIGNAIFRKDPEHISTTTVTNGGASLSFRSGRDFVTIQANKKESVAYINTRGPNASEHWDRAMGLLSRQGYKDIRNM